MTIVSTRHIRGVLIEEQSIDGAQYAEVLFNETVRLEHAADYATALLAELYSITDQRIKFKTLDGDPLESSNADLSNYDIDGEVSLLSGDLPLEIGSVNCKIPLDERAWDVLMDLDKRYIDDDDDECGVLKLLEERGASEIEYNGHFGRAIYLTCNDEPTAKRLATFIDTLLREDSIKNTPKPA